MSDAHGYSAENMLAQLPRVLAEDDRMLALATAITRALMTHHDELRLEEIYTRIDELPADLLDILAVDFSIDWWDGDWSVERKRQTVKDSWQIHRLLGTPHALALAVQAAFGAGRAEEWWEYGGAPHHFRVVDLSPEMAQTGYNAFIRLLALIKRESSVLDAVVMQSIHEDHLHSGCGVVLCRRIAVDCAHPAHSVAYLIDEDDNLLADEDGSRYIDNEED